MSEPAHCLKCGWKWRLRKPRRENSRCPGCFNFFWWEPRVYQKHIKPLPEAEKES